MRQGTVCVPVMARGGFLLIFAAVATVGAATAAAWPATADTSRTPQDPLRRGSAASYAMPDTCETLKISSKYFFYHSHIPKAGGRSFYSIFRRSPRIPGITPCRQSVYSRTSDCPMKGDPVCPQRFAEIRENFQAHRSYGDCNFLSFETPSLIASLQNELDMPDVKVMTTFREPVSHFVSQYLHDRRHGRINNNITRYINGGIGYQKRCGVGNFQMCRLGVKTLSAAKDLVSQIFHFGILEYWDASICLLYYQLGRFNRSKCANLCSDDRGAVIKAHIGTAPDKQLVSAKLDLSVLRRMGDLNKVDAELYAWATQVFFARVRRVEVQENVTLLCEMHV
mmetsp:Transcript_31902/g.81685  ORF Transcript_31902/g.81685 Transcript_31902/m.81685 type:complete len:338 (-) Transcript_31902:55-1068(-)